MGALALYFVQRYVESQEGDYLRANANAVAQQAQRFLEPQLRRVALQNLASTAAFLGDAARADPGRGPQRLRGLRGPGPPG